VINNSPFTMPMPRFAMAAPGSAASQRIKRLEEENAKLRQALADLQASHDALKRVAFRPRSKASSDASDSEVSSESSCAVVSARPGYRMVEVPVPPFRPFDCSFCHERGHTIDQCVPAFLDRIEKMWTHCIYHYHSPYQHDRDWRCNWCGKHLCEEEVKSFPGWERRVKNPTPAWEKDPKPDNGHFRPGGKGKGKGK